MLSLMHDRDKSWYSLDRYQKHLCHSARGAVGQYWTLAVNTRWPCWTKTKIHNKQIKFEIQKI